MGRGAVAAEMALHVQAAFRQCCVGRWVAHLETFSAIEFTAMGNQGIGFGICFVRQEPVGT